MKAVNLMETMSVEDIKAVETSVKSLRKKLPSLVTLTMQERKLLSHPRPEALSLMDRTLAVAKQNPGLMPKQLDLSVFDRDVRLLQALDQCYAELQHFASDLRDTFRTVASDPLKLSREIRAYVIAASKRAPALKEVATRLVERRARASRSAKGPVSAEVDEGAAPPPPSPGPAPQTSDAAAKAA